MHLVTCMNFCQFFVFSTLDSGILNLTFVKVSGCKSYPSIQAHELNTSILNLYNFYLVVYTDYM